jgi:hypothetical protein
MDNLETTITLETRHRTKTYSTKKTQTQKTKRMSNTHLAKKTSGDDTSVRGTQAVSLSASYKTHTKCVNN